MICIPVLVSAKNWKPCFVTKEGEFIERQTHGNYTEEKQCQVICSARNNRVGYTDKKVKKLLKTLIQTDGKKGKKGKKRKKGKKGSKS